MKIDTSIILSNLAVYGIAHGVVDATCAAVVFSIIKNQIAASDGIFTFIILYNVLAFGTQVVFGLIVDYLKSPRLPAILGCILTGISTLVYINNPTLAVIMAGLGNSLFHVGGGSISLNLTPKKATAPGIFVAPGALGLLLGTFLAGSENFMIWYFLIALIFLCVLMFFVNIHEMNYKKIINKYNYFGLIIILVLLSIAIRSFVGVAVAFPWKTNINLLIVLTIAVMLGKGLGGLLADRFGWIKVGVGALLISMPILSFASNYPLLAIPGMFLFNITMPVTLVAVANILPGRPGFAFGLTCLALIMGALPSLLNIELAYSEPVLLFGIIFISVGALFSGLKLLLSKNIMYDGS